MPWTVQAYWWCQHRQLGGGTITVPGPQGTAVVPHGCCNLVGSQYYWPRVTARHSPNSNLLLT